jgi:hypothetical protein
MSLTRSLIILIVLFTCIESLKSQNNKNVTILTEDFKSEKIKVLNFGTFHMGFTPDANTTEFNENNKKNIDSVHQIAKMLAEFKPTVIIVETRPAYNQKLKEKYEIYLKNSDTIFPHQDEIELLAFELGRLSNTKSIYGIDHKLNYNYNIGAEINNTVDSITYNSYMKNPFKNIPEIDIDYESLSLLNKLKLMNHPKYLDFLIEINADILTHAGTDGNFEGADEAAKYYQRNLRMYSNLNRIPLKMDDRVFILMGGSHTAFFRDFFSRSPKYEMVNTFDYLK